MYIVKKQYNIHVINNECHRKLNNIVEKVEDSIECLRRKKHKGVENAMLSDALAELRSLSSVIDRLAGHGEQYESFYENYMKELEHIASQPHE